MDTGKLVPRIPQRMRRFSERRFRERLTVFSICILIACFLWLVIKLSESYVAEVEYPVKFSNRTGDKILAGASESTIRIRMEAKGFRVLNLKWFGSSDTLRLDIDYRNFHDFPTGKRYNFFVYAEKLIPQVASSIEEIDHVTGISPDTFYFWMDEKVSRKLPVVLRSNISYSKQFQPYRQPDVEPDSLMVSGPSRIVDTLTAVRTEMFEASGVKNDVSEELQLQLPEKVKARSKTVNLKIDVEEFTEASVKIPVETEKAATNSDCNIKTFPEQVKVTYWIALKDYQKVSEAQFTASVNCEDMMENEEKIRVKITRFPSYLKNIRVSPRYVEYVIQNSGQQ